MVLLNGSPALFHVCPTDVGGGQQKLVTPIIVVRNSGLVNGPDAAALANLTVTQARLNASLARLNAIYRATLSVTLSGVRDKVDLVGLPIRYPENYDDKKGLWFCDVILDQEKVPTSTSPSSDWRCCAFSRTSTPAMGTCGSRPS